MSGDNDSYSGSPMQASQNPSPTGSANRPPLDVFSSPVRRGQAPPDSSSPNISGALLFHRAHKRPAEDGTQYASRITRKLKLLPADEKELTLFAVVSSRISDRCAYV